jgi:hypothetical protein
MDAALRSQALQCFRRHHLHSPPQVHHSSQPDRLVAFVLNLSTFLIVYQQNPILATISADISNSLGYEGAWAYKAVTG